MANFTPDKLRVLLLEQGCPVLVQGDSNGYSLLGLMQSALDPENILLASRSDGEVH